MKRSHQRLWAQATALAQRLRSQLHHVLDTEIDEQGERRDAQVAEASAMADAASATRRLRQGGPAARLSAGQSAALIPEAQRVLGRVWDQLPATTPPPLPR